MLPIYPLKVFAPQKQQQQIINCCITAVMQIWSQVLYKMWLKKETKLA